MLRITDRTSALGSVPEDALVLDVGGASAPMGRADWVLDIQPFREVQASETRDGVVPRFRRDTWVRHDACSAEPWPFADKMFDFAICSHTLEDVRDPIRMCRELSRVAKAGYVEVPSREWESTMGVELRFELPRQAGLYHHRWLCEVDDGKLIFIMKPAFMHGSRLYSFPRRMARRWAEEDKLLLRLLWEGELPGEERLFDSITSFQENMRDFVTRYRGRTLGMWAYDNIFVGLRRLYHRFIL